MGTSDFRGTNFIGDESGEALPVLGLGFDDTGAVTQIFAGWRELVGPVDERSLIQIVIIKGILRRNPAAYRVATFANPQSNTTGERRLILTPVQSQTMESTNGVSLRLFLEHYEKKKAYWLSFAKAGDITARLNRDMVIRKQNLIVRESWSIGPRETEMMTIQPNDDPVIPEGQENPPILETLNRVRQASALITPIARVVAFEKNMACGNSCLNPIADCQRAA